MAPGTSRCSGRRALAGALWLLLDGALGCGGGVLSATDGGFRHLRHGYSFADPGAPWKRIEVEHAAVAYRRGPATMSLQSRCAGPLADAATMARHLRIGIGPHTLRQSGPFDVAGRSAWSQVFDTLRSGAVVRVKTVTLVAGRCTFDWVLVAGGEFGSAEPDFDAWISSLRLPDEPGVAP